VNRPMLRDNYIDGVPDSTVVVLGVGELYQIFELFAHYRFL